MGQLVYIGAKKHAVEKLNKVLDKMKIENAFTTEQDNISWLKDINENPGSPQAHLKPTDRDLTMEELLRLFPSLTEVGLMTFDVAFSRTSEEEAQKYLAFIKKYKNSIEYLKGAQELIERYETTAEDKKVIKLLNVKEKEPEKLPVEERTKKDLQGGHLLCKSWGLQPFWVIFGKVKDDRPVFMKDRQYKDDAYNSLYRDKKGYGYLLIPLLPLNNSQLEFVEKVYDDAWSMGLRECFTYFIPVVYGLDIVNIDKVAKDYKEFYTVEELKERFYSLMKTTSDIFPYNGPNGFVWRDLEKMFKPCGTSTPSIQIQTKCHVLTALLRALGPKISAEIMTKLTGKTYKEFEF